MTKERYNIFINTHDLGIIKTAECILVEDHGVLTEFGFRYTNEYLENPAAFSLDPVLLPLHRGNLELTCTGGIPGLIDDYLPDAWGRKVLSQLAFYRDKIRLNGNSAIESLSILGRSRIGAIQIIRPDQSPDFGLGAHIAELAKAENIAQQVDAPDFNDFNPDEISLLYLANNGTGIGGARPKALIYDETGAYIAKFNRFTQDSYNNARVEKTCLDMANSIGITDRKATIHAGINGREVLLIDRFDINENSSRNHLVSINSLLKQPETQRDFYGAFRYDDIYNIIQQYSGDITTDLEKLLKTMLFNRMINNTDDHERNFSLQFNGNHYHLSPAYDMVPSLQKGSYHAAGFQHFPSPPKLSEVSKFGRIFGLSKNRVAQCTEQIMSVGKQWQEYAEKNAVEEQQIELIFSYFNF